MIAGALLAALITIATGILIVATLLPNHKRSFVGSVLLLALGFPVGMGVSSCIYVLSRQFWGQDQLILIFTDVLVLGLSVAFYLIRRPKAAAGSTPVAGLASSPGVIFKSLFCLLFTAGLLAFAFQYFMHPDGDWNALMVWNLKAKMLATAGSHWKEALLFSKHPDYPLLLPATVARLWEYFQGQPAVAPGVVAALFYLSTVGVLWCAIREMSGSRAGLLATCILISAPLLTVYATYQYAGMPFACFVLISCACLYYSERDQDDRNGWLILCGLSAGLAAWTKLEGLLFLLSLFWTYVIVTQWKKPRPIQRPFLILSGALLPLCVYCVFKLAVPAANELIDTSDLLDPMRYLVVGQYFLISAVTFGGWLVSPVPLMIIYWLVSPKRDANTASTACSAAWLMMFAACFAIAVCKPSDDLNTQMIISLSRQLLQLWPSAVLIFALSLKPAEEQTEPHVVAVS